MYARGEEWVSSLDLGNNVNQSLEKKIFLICCLICCVCWNSNFSSLSAKHSVLFYYLPKNLFFEIGHALWCHTWIICTYFWYNSIFWYVFIPKYFQKYFQMRLDSDILLMSVFWLVKFEFLPEVFPIGNSKVVIWQLFWKQFQVWKVTVHYGLWGKTSRWIA